MTRKYTNYDDDFKRMLVELVNGGKGINEVSREYGVPSSSIRGWIKRFSKISTPNKEESIEYAEIYTFIELLKVTHSQQKVCKTLGVPKSTYYINLKKQPTKTETRRNDFLKVS